MSELDELAQKIVICTQSAPARAAKTAKAITHAPESVKNTLTRAFSGEASPRQAIKAMCLTCVGFDRQEVKNCSAYACPLWAYRPFQGGE